MCPNMFKDHGFYEWGTHWNEDGKLTRDEAHKHLTRYALCTTNETKEEAESFAVKSEKYNTYNKQTGQFE